MKNNQKGFGVVELVIVIAVFGLVIGLGCLFVTKHNKTQQYTTSKQAVSAPSKSPFEGYLQSPESYQATSFTLPAAGWDANDGWDTAAGFAAQEQQVANLTNGNAVAESGINMPAVIAKDAKTLELNVMVGSIGKVSGKPSCKIEAFSEAGNMTKDKYYTAGSWTVADDFGAAIQPGKWVYRVYTLTIPNDGALQIKKIAITCQ